MGTIGDPLQLVEDVKNESFVIKGLVTEGITTIRQIFDKLKRGELNRHYAETHMNHSSSRSHCLFRLTIKAVTSSYIREYRQKNQGKSNINAHELDHSNMEGTIVTESYLNFVDLAGNERMSAHLNQYQGRDEDGFEDLDSKRDALNSRIKESQHINKSLFFLTQVISIKAEGKANQYVPFRNSQLTKILRSSLGGNFRTAVVLNLNPCSSQVEVSLSTLRFGTNAKKIQNKIKANIITNNDDETVKILIENYERRIRELEHKEEEDGSKYQQYINIIEELKVQRSALLERLEQVNKRFSIAIAQSIPDTELRKFFTEAKNGSTYFESTGPLFNAKALDKYREMGKNDEEFLSEIDLDKMKRRFDDEMKISSKDFVHKMTYNMYTKVKAEYEELRKIVGRQKEYITNFCFSYKTLCEFMKNITGLGQTYLVKLGEISKQYQDEYILSNEREIKLELYENLKGMSLLTDKDLETMNEYIMDFHDALKSEKDRRELLAKDAPDMPESVKDALKSLFASEREEQLQNLNTKKEKLQNFVNFKEGCQAEIEYYKSLNKDFDHTNQIDIKVKEIEKIINVDLVQMTEKIQKMDSNFKICDHSIDQGNKNELDQKLKEYKNKFEKFVDAVLARKSDVRDSLGEELNSDRKQLSDKGHLRRQRSNSIVIEERESIAFRRGGTLVFDRGAVEGKIKGWLNLKEIEQRTMNFDSALKDETMSMSNYKSPNTKTLRDIDMHSDYQSVKEAHIPSSMFNSPMIKKDIGLAAKKMSVLEMGQLANHETDEPDLKDFDSKIKEVQSQQKFGMTTLPKSYKKTSELRAKAKLPFRDGSLFNEFNSKIGYLNTNSKKEDMKRSFSHTFENGGKKTDDHIKVTDSLVFKKDSDDFKDSNLTIKNSKTIDLTTGKSTGKGGKTTIAKFDTKMNPPSLAQTKKELLRDQFEFKSSYLQSSEKSINEDKPVPSLSNGFESMKRSSGELKHESISPRKLSKSKVESISKTLNTPGTKSKPILFDMGPNKQLKNTSEVLFGKLEKYYPLKPLKHAKTQKQ